MNNKLPADYHDRVYAGVLGEVIGVHIGRSRHPFYLFFYLFARSARPLQDESRLR